MKKCILILALAFLALMPASKAAAAPAQKGSVKLMLVDSLTREAASYAAVMLLADGDTLAKYYALAGLDGKATLERVEYGTYTLKAELVGYKPLSKKITLNRNTLNLGTLAMLEDYQMLQGATVSAVGSAITIKQDTIEYTASSFKVKDNAVLLDLLKKLPGIEVSSDGSITSQGETINKITLNGKTFFLDDPSLATENIPVKVVDKVKVIDKKSEQAQFSGIEDDDTEKVIDVSTYKGMFDGWFGNFSGGLGRDMRSNAGSDSRFDLSNDIRYQGNGILGRFNETDQLAIVANGNNTNSRGGFGGWGGQNGINDEWMTGVNYGTTRIKDLEANVSLEVGSRKSDVQSKNEKTTYMTDEPDLSTSSDSKNYSGEQFVELGGELRYTPERTRIIFRPRFNLEVSTTDKESSSSTSGNNSEDIYDVLNDSRSFDYGITRSRTADGRFMIGRRIGQKAGRTISLGGRYSFSGSDKDAKEFSQTRYYSDGSAKLIDQYSHTDSKAMSLNGNLDYTEPIADNWFLSAQYRVNYSHNNSVKTTSDYTGEVAHSTDDTAFIRDMSDTDLYSLVNEYYSSSVENIFINQRAGLMVQYQKERNFLQFGASVQPTYNETHTTKFGITTDMGEGEWLLNWSPEVRAHYNFSPTTNIRAFYSGRSSQPSTSRMLPILDVSNPTSISTGNGYLLPSFNHNADVRFATNNKYTFSSFNLGLNASYGKNSVVTASWFDTDGVNYSIPVNAKKPSLTMRGHMIYNTPIARSNFSVVSNTMASVTDAVSYQNVVQRAGLDAETFDYDEFMKDFWGETSAGERFYTGESGFAESKTTAYSVTEDLSLRYNGDKLYATVGGKVRYNNALYSLNSSADKHTIDNSVSASFILTLWEKLELSSDANYTFYHGYSEGYNDPEFIWNAGISYKFGSFSLAASAFDLLEQSKSIARTTTENYLLDSWSNRLGRYVMFKLTYTFGKFAGGDRGPGFGGPGGPGGPGGRRGPRF